MRYCGAAVGQSLVAMMAGKLVPPRRPAVSMVFHYDVARRTDVLSRTVIAETWRYTEWDRGSAGRELYLRTDDPGEYRNRSGEPLVAEAERTGQEVLSLLPAPKPGPANRPRALLPASEKSR